jgi:pimeloyl-ACP methyl ester carboxylesterase
MVQHISAPTLLLQGTKDRLVPVAASRALATLRPDWSFVLFEGVGHVPQLEVADRFVATVTNWLESLAPGHAALAAP